MLMVQLHFAFSFSCADKLMQESDPFLVITLGLQPHDKAAMLVVKTKETFLLNSHQNRVQFPARNVFVLDPHHGRRDISCKPAIASRVACIKFLLLYWIYTSKHCICLFLGLPCIRTHFVGSGCRVIQITAYAFGVQTSTLPKIPYLARTL